MNSQTQQIIQNILAVIGGYLLLKGIDGGLITEGTGIAMGVAAVVWGIFNRDVNGGAIIASVRNIVTFVGGILVAKGKLSSTDLATWLGIVIALASAIMAALHIDSTAPATNSVKK